MAVRSGAAHDVLAPFLGKWNAQAAFGEEPAASVGSRAAVTVVYLARS
jgi:hypothetical protein